MRTGWIPTHNLQYIGFLTTTADERSAKGEPMADLSSAVALPLLVGIPRPVLSF